MFFPLNYLSQFQFLNLHTFLVTTVTIDEKREIREQIFDQLEALKSKIPFDFECIVAAMMRQRIEIEN